MKKFLGLIAAASLLVAAPAFASVDLSLNGGTVTVQQGQSYVEPGYSAVSTTDGDITSSVVVDQPDLSKPGNYTIGYSVSDSALDTASASRSVVVSGGGGTLPYCSGPTAPGWRADLPDGGCGGAVQFIAAPGTHGCPEWFSQPGCVIKK